MLMIGMSLSFWCNIMNMTANSYIDSSSQKAFLKGINSCIKHIQIFKEVIQDTKQKKATVHCS